MRPKAYAEFVAKCIRIEQCCNSGSRVVTVLRQWGIEYEPDQQHVSRALQALGLTDARSVATPGTDDVGGPKSSQISELRRPAKWHHPPEEVREEDDLRIEGVPERSGEIQFPFYGQARPLVLSERVDAKNGLNTH